MALALTWPVGRADLGTERSAPPPAGPVVAYIVASTIGGAATALALALISYKARQIAPTAEIAVVVLAAVLGLVAVGLEWKGTLGPLPQRRAQVPRRWLLWRRRNVTAIAFGLVIGSGVLTHLQHATTYALAAVIALAPSIELGTALGALYGLSRGITLGLTWLADRRGHERPSWARARPHGVVNRVLATVAAASILVALLTL
jgi:hypothetical protein